MKKIIKGLFSKIGYEIDKSETAGAFDVIFKKYNSFTMIPQKAYVDNLKLVKQYVTPLAGDIVECGVWRGGMIAGIAELLGNERHYHLFDSFEGLPPARDIDGESAIAWQKNTEGENYFDNCAAEISFAKTAMESTNGKNYTLHKGWFNETLVPFKASKPIALLRLDGDWYDSTMDCFKYLYPQVIKGGLILIDDYYAWDGCSRAVHDYLSSIKSQSRIQSSKNGTCYILKLDDINAEG